jgi:hypothetical protein
MTWPMSQTRLISQTIRPNWSRPPISRRYSMVGFAVRYSMVDCALADCLGVQETRPRHEHSMEAIN